MMNKNTESITKTRSKVLVKTSYRRKDCRLCGSRNIEIVLALEPTPVADAYITQEQLREAQEIYSLELALCKDCNNCFILDVVDPEVLYKNFLYVSSSSPGLLEHFQRYADEVVFQLKPKKDSLAVDIGSNDGILLRAFKNHDLRVLGIDPARETARRATESGIETLPVYFTVDLAQKIKAQYGPATVITANNVIANVDNIKIFIQGVRDLLAEDGVFIFETGYLLDLIANKVFDNIYHEHLSYFSVRALQTFFESIGMELIDVKRMATKGGSIRGFVQKKGAKRKVSPAVEQILRSEKDFGLDTRAPFEGLASNLNAVKKELTKVVNDLKKQGKIIFGYGASPSVTTLLYYFELQNVLTCLIDDNPLKYSRFSPAQHIPILPSESIYEKNPDYIVVLAWRFSNHMIKRHEKFINKGGEFILILPKVEIIKGIAR